jgi:hypothetical protein
MLIMCIIRKHAYLLSYFLSCLFNDFVNIETIVSMNVE